MAERDDEAQPFLSRWSRRKREARADDAERQETGETAARSEQRDEAAAAAEAEALEANRAAAEAIDLGTLDEKSDYQPFFRPGVPAALKSAALQRLWRSNPVFANLDGLNDYDGDYTFPTSPAGLVRTAYKVGRGFLDDPAAKPEETPDHTGEATVAEAAPAAAAASGKVRVGAGPDDTVEAAGLDVPVTDESEIPSEAPDRIAAEAEPVRKVALARRIDLAAFATPDDD
jgi:hypothetical protein